MSGPGVLSYPIGGIGPKIAVQTQIDRLRDGLDDLVASVNQRVPGAYNVKGYGAKGNSLTDDTAAIRTTITTALTEAAAITSGNVFIPTIYFGPGRYLVSGNPFSPAIGYGASPRPFIVKLDGAQLSSTAQIKIPQQCVIQGTGRNNCGFVTRGNVPFVASVSISSIARSSNVVTVTTSGAHGLEVGSTVRPSGVSDTSFDGGFQVVSVPSSVTATWAQTGANATSSGGTLYIPFVVLGDKDPWTFSSRLENLSIGMRAEAGSIPLYSNNINEQCGAQQLLIFGYAFRGIWIEYIGAGDLPRPYNYRFEDLELYAEHGYSATGVYIRGQQTLHRGFNHITIGTTSVVADSAAVAMDISGAPGVYSRVHIEAHTNGIVVGDRGSASDPNTDSAGIVIEGVTGHSTNGTLVRLNNAGEVNNIVVMGLAKNSGTNVLVDEVNSITLTDAYVALYAMGAGASGALITTVPAIGNRLEHDLEVGNDLTVTDEIIVNGGLVTVTPLSTVSTVRTNTVDGTDTASLKLTPGSSPSTSRGALLILSGNEEVSLGGGYARLTSGAISGSVLQLNNGVVGAGIAVNETDVTDALPHVAPYYRDTISTPAQIVADTDNYDPGTAGWLRLSTDASRNITGFTGGASCRELTITNIGAQNIVLVNEATSTAANQIITGTGGNITVAPLDTIEAKYDSVSSRWRVTSHY